MATSKRKKVLIGCGLGCGFLLLLGVGSCIGFGVWINSPGDLLEPTSLVGDATTGYVEWTMQLEDPGTSEFVELLISRFQGIRESSGMPLPGGLGDRLNEMQSNRDAKKLRALFPMTVAWTLQPGESPEDDLHMVTVSSKKFDHQMTLVDWIVGWAMRRDSDGDVEKYRGENLYRIVLDGQVSTFAFFIRSGDVFVTSDIQAARIAVDRLIDPAQRSDGAAEFTRLYERADDLPLRGAMSNHGGALLRIWQEYFDADVLETTAREMWDGIEGLTLTGSFTGEGSFDLALDFHFPDADAAAEAEGDLGLAVGRATERSLLLELQGASVVGRRLRFDLQAGELVQRLEELDDDR